MDMAQRHDEDAMKSHDSTRPFGQMVDHNQYYDP
jgi:hypothetical protein